MATAYELKFKGRDISMAEFVDQFGADLPQMLLITQGFHGCDEELHCISADEMYWISRLLRQKRIIAKEVCEGKPQPRYLSIPVEYPHRFHMLQDRRGKDFGLAMPLEKIVERMKVTPSPHLITIENSAIVNFSNSGAKSSSMTLGVLEILDVYSQKYLLGHSIYDDIMDPVAIAIPVYMDITLDVVDGIVGRSQAAFDVWIKEVNEIGLSYENTATKLNPDIIQLQGIPEGGRYEYIRPAMYLTRQGNKGHFTPTNNRSYTQLQRIEPTDSHVDNPPPPLPPPRGQNRSLAPQRKQEKRRLPPVRPESPAPPPPSPTSSAPTIVHSTETGGVVNRFQDASEIPSDLDVSALTTDDVAHCLCLLGMWKYAVALRDRQVDGAMLLNVDEAILTSDFNFSQFDAMKIIKFVRGWRPNTGTTQ